MKYPNSICRINGYDKDAYDFVPVVIIGAGESGIAMGCRLKEVLGFDQFRIYERQAGLGGTWWINRYPGVACDVPAIFYSFSFAPNPRWTAFHPSGQEIVKYLNDVCTKYEIVDKIQCNTDISECRWIEEEEVWEVTLKHMYPGTGDLSVKDRNKKMEAEGESAVFIKTEKIRSKVVVSCVGGLVEPKGWPEHVKGSEDFKGEIFHSARWRYDVDLTGKNVVVLGTGCSAAQFVPRLTKEFNAKKVTQLMRSPPWVVPRMQPPFGEEKWSKYSATVLSNVPGLNTLLRKLVFFVAESEFVLFGSSQKAEKARKRVENSLLRHMQRTVPKKYHEMLTPNYGVGCKRRIFDASWFPGLQDDSIELSTQPLKSVQQNSVTIGPGQSYPENGPYVAIDEREIPADVIILANGFEVSKWAHPLKVIGKGGRDLLDEMDARGGPQAYQGTAMDLFPNCFFIFGPNTATGHSSVILASENMVEYSLNFIKKIIDGDATTVEVKKEAEQAYTADLQKALKDTVWMNGGCHSWYFDETNNNWNSTVYPYTQIWFGLRCMFPVWSDWNIKYTRKGLLKQRLSQAVKTILIFSAIVAAYKARQSGQGMSYFTNLFRSTKQWIATSLG